ncbi:hypothetical protein GF371_02665 [Candidatus Woesearchaeota archaeon]|nr:hypothetical protein [Candidatus Woesearchaeota archaeon]
MAKKRYRISRKELEKERIREERMYKGSNNFLGRFLYIVFALLIVGIFAGGYFYFFIYSPAFVEKPVIEKPVIADEEEFEVTEEQVEYIANEAGGYKLRSHPVTKEKPVIEFFITNFRDTYTLTVDDHNLTAVEGSAINPDVRLSGTKEVFRQLLDSKDFEKDIRRLVRWRDIEVEILADKSILVMKGYKSLYDALEGDGEDIEEQQGAGQATGFFEVGSHAGISSLGFMATVNKLFLAGFMCLFIAAFALGYNMHEKHK